MIQRIQSIYLFIAVVLIAVSGFVGDAFYIITKKSNVAYSYQSISERTLDLKFVMNEEKLFLWIFPVLLAAFGVYVLFSYKRLAKQVKLARYFWGLTIMVLLLQLVLKYYFQYQVDKQDLLQANMGRSFFISLIAMPFAHLAFMAILRDKRKIDSIDRIR